MAKPAKRQGPIRFEAVVPLAIVLGTIVLYFILFFDMHLRHALEYGATQANGAEVDIGKLDTSFWKASVAIGDIAMTNPEQPGRNRVQIGAINFRMLWDGLLRGKVVINEASIIDVQIDTARKSPGLVLPVKKKEEGEGVGDKMLSQAKEEFSGNVLGDLAAIASGTDSKDQLAQITGELKSGAAIDAIQRELDEKDQQWKKRLADLPDKEDFSALQQRLSKVKPKNPKDVSQVKASLKELESIRNDYDAKAKAVRETGSAITGDLGKLKGSISGLDKLVKADVSDLQSRMHLPSLDVRTLSRALFGMDVLGKVQQTRGYMEKARSYMPAKSEKKKPVAVQTRGKGRNYAFGRPNSYPAFWLRKALISSRQAGGASDLSGEIRDASTDQSLVGRPMVATLKGSLPSKGVSGIKAELVIDHTSSVPVERMMMEIGKYAVAGRTLANSPSVELGISKAEGSSRFAAKLQEDNVDVHVTNRFTQVAFETKAQSPVVREMMNASLAGINAVNMDASVTGTWSNLNWKMSTNLADALVGGMQKYLQERMNAAKARIEAMVNEKIADKRKRLIDKQNEIEGKLKSVVAERQAQLEAIRKKIDQSKKELLGAQQDKVKQGIGNALDKLRKRF